MQSHLLCPGLSAGFLPTPSASSTFSPSVQEPEAGPVAIFLCHPAWRCPSQALTVDRFNLIPRDLNQCPGQQLRPESRLEISVK